MSYDGCGFFDPEDDSDDVTDRIVNGYRVWKFRPWMARMVYVTEGWFQQC